MHKTRGHKYMKMPIIKMFVKYDKLRAPVVQFGRRKHIICGIVLPLPAPCLSLSGSRPLFIHAIFLSYFLWLYFCFSESFTFSKERKSSRELQFGYLCTKWIGDSSKRVLCFHNICLSVCLDLLGQQHWDTMPLLDGCL